MLATHGPQGTAWSEHASALDALATAIRASGESRDAVGLHTSPSAAQGQLVALALAVAAGPSALLLSDETRQFVEGRIEDLCVLQPLGPARFADLGPPQPVWALSAPGLTQVAGPLGLDAVTHNLPIRLLPFVGRVDAVNAIANALGPGRTVTVTGPGGIGKTEVALRAAAVAAGHRFAVVRLVELASLAADDVAGSIDEAMAEEPTLLVLDCCEHVVDAVRAALGHYPSVAVLVSSRVPLDVPGETLERLAPLDSGAATELFLDRSARAGAPPTTTPAVVAELCERLDGLPLAIELAAARTRVLSAADIVGRLHRRFTLLPRNPDARQAHHETLEDAIAWSYDLLGAEEQQLFVRFGVFAGRFDLDAATALGGTLDLLDALVTRSLVVSEPEAALPYRLLDSVREFAAARLCDDELRLSRDALMAWLSQFTDVLDGDDSQARDAVFARLDGAASDVRTAIEHAIAVEPATAVMLVSRLGPWFWDRGRVADGRRLAQAALAVDPEDDPAATARIVNAAANLAVRGGEPEAALALYERAIALRTSIGGEAQLASSKNDLGVCHLHLDDLERAHAQFEEAKAIYERAGDEWGVATTTVNLASAAVERGELDGAASAFAAAAATLRSLGDNAQAAAATINHGLVLVKAGDAGRAGPVLAEALDSLIEMGLRSLMPAALLGAAHVAAAAGNYPDAARLWGAAVALGRRAKATTASDDALATQLLTTLNRAERDAYAQEGADLDDRALCALVRLDATTTGSHGLSTTEATLRRTDDGWTVTFGGHAATLASSKGMTYLARLLEHGGREIHVADLAGVALVQRGVEAIDDQAYRAYRQRVEELSDRLELADARGDAVASAAAQSELDALRAQLSSTSGRLGPRRAGDDSERVRKAVGNRLRATFRVLSAAHPQLARHLERSIRTGTYCCYSPEQQIDWTVSTA